MSDFLAGMARRSAARAARAPRRFAEDRLERPLFPLARGGFDIIAEIKERSPSAGALGGRHSDRARRAQQYASGGVAAVSVLTEPQEFGGDLAHLDEVAGLLAAHAVPAMRKDFLVDPVQLLEARAAGASGVLLIAAMLDDRQLAALLDCARDLGLWVLLEAFDEADLQRLRALLATARHGDSAAAGRLLVGVNARDLRTLDVDAGRLERLVPLLPAGVPACAESGLATAEDVAAAAGWGYALALVGSALMRAGDPAALVADMRRAGRARRAA